MSVCTFIASDKPLRRVAPKEDYPLLIQEDGTLYDNGADDNFYLYPLLCATPYTDKRYSVALQWQKYTEGRAKAILEYIKNALEQGNAIELWHVWLMEYYEWDERPVIRKRTVSFSDLTVDDIKSLDDAEVWNQPDKWNPGRPTFYCLVVEP